MTTVNFYILQLSQSQPFLAQLAVLKKEGSVKDPTIGVILITCIFAFHWTKLDTMGSIAWSA